MADNHPLSDEEVYDLIHQALASLLNKTVRTKHAQDVLSMAIRDLSIIQTAFLTLSEGVKLPQGDPEQSPRPE
ncbi:hypothetical protein [Rhizobium leguminosarum]|jgi:hypothetical protein|uniref:Uncharacterized protein n=1 Tax=Rhizobium leguminosarum bv. viciae TaxID=387 RepID=A0A7G6RJA9_RHILV|nr:hypothetical protein [Rhizobium leguminosarum]ASS57580.1 hypothetical protein CHR56_25180 [Rhizobium leguminosarum bv. viciae]QND42341.1 hypothetical protein HB770_11110 [Rhizobium leguminosarum bv. viciae]TBY17498.1 hypothetical protein E0H30_26115 [Rhizobium leguminosarum bv. viciae]TBY24613.1 hypothetical protein E0H37_23105 [Rhizobium leguminosarum bv. viciae]TBY99723.1 hypothetical protein E0H49_17575 [Rhizobium leguminosarum bv. viciae]